MPKMSVRTYQLEEIIEVATPEFVPLPHDRNVKGQEYESGERPLGAVMLPPFL